MVVNQSKTKNTLCLVLIIIQVAILFDFPAPLAVPLARVLSPLHILTKNKIDKKKVYDFVQTKVQTHHHTI